MLAPLNPRMMAPRVCEGDLNSDLFPAEEGDCFSGANCGSDPFASSELLENKISTMA